MWGYFFLQQYLLILVHAFTKDIARNIIRVIGTDWYLHAVAGVV
jgi:hypothetical protein